MDEVTFSYLVPLVGREAVGDIFYRADIADFFVRKYTRCFGTAEPLEAVRHALLGRKSGGAVVFGEIVDSERVGGVSAERVMLTGEDIVKQGL